VYVDLGTQNMGGAISNAMRGRVPVIVFAGTAPYAMRVLDTDVPYIESDNKPSPDATLYVVDIDPLKPSMSLWHVPARRSAAANSKVAVKQIAGYVREHIAVDRELVEARRARVAAERDRHRAEWDALEQPQNGEITPQYLTACVRELLAAGSAPACFAACLPPARARVVLADRLRRAPGRGDVIIGRSDRHRQPGYAHWAGLAGRAPGLRVPARFWPAETPWPVEGCRLMRRCRRPDAPGGGARKCQR